MISDKSHSFYKASLAIATLGIVFSWIEHQFLLADLLFCIAGLLTVIGVIIKLVGLINWVWKLSSSLRRHRMIKWFFRITLPLIPASILLLSRILAKNYVENVLQLPGVDFPLTINVMTGFSIIPICSICIIVLLILMLLANFTKIIYHAAVSRGASMLKIIAPPWTNIHIQLNEVETKSAQKGIDSIGDLSGVYILLILFAIFFSLSIPQWPNLITWVAYYADYSPASKYPGFEQLSKDPFARIITHEGKIISLATFRDNKVVFDSASKKSIPTE